MLYAIKSINYHIIITNVIFLDPDVNEDKAKAFLHAEGRGISKLPEVGRTDQNVMNRMNKA